MTLSIDGRLGRPASGSLCGVRISELKPGLGAALGATVADLIDEIMGEGGDAEEAAAQAAAGLSPPAAALTLNPRRRRTKGADAADAFLDEERVVLKKQEAMLDLQYEHLRDDGLRLRVRRWRETLQFGLQVFLAVAATVVGLVLAVMLSDAVTAHSVVVDAFKAPPALASRGVSGEVVAEGVLDALRTMQDATRTTVKGPDTHGAWASDIKIEVPETGVSLGEIDRVLHQRFGHDVHITGELVQTETGGLALTVRGDAIPAATFAGAAGELGNLTKQAAEYLYGRSQPTQFATYLTTQGRNADAIAFLKDAFPRATKDVDRTKLANAWGNAYASLNQNALSADKYRLSMTFAKPQTSDWWRAWGNLIGAKAPLDEETAWREGHAMLQAAAAAPQQPDVRYLVNAAYVTWDFPLVLESNLADAKFNSGAGASTNPDGATIADAYGWLHDYASAMRYMALSDPADPITKLEPLMLEAEAALDRGDAATAASAMDVFYKAWLADPNAQYTFTSGPCIAGLAFGLSGRLQDAETAFKGVPNQSLCYAAHGDVLVQAGDVAGAQHVWAEGLKSTPDLPAVPFHRGLFELRQGDLKDAEADFALAAYKAPHWAEPLKGLGDVRMAQRRWRDALAKYDAALKYAPAWAALRQARAAAAQKAR